MTYQTTFQRRLIPLTPPRIFQILKTLIFSIGQHYRRRLAVFLQNNRLATKAAEILADLAAKLRQTSVIHGFTPRKFYVYIITQKPPTHHKSPQESFHTA